MRVGIISMQRIVNYGSFLQAYSLKNTIEKMGHEVEFVDYEIEPPVVPNPNKDYEPPKRKNVVQKAINYVWENRSPKSRKIRKYNRYLMNLGKDFRELYFPLLGIKEERNPRAKEDVIVIGSDEVFNCLQINPDVGYSRQLFGKDANAQRVMSYAASFGTTTVEGLEKYGIKEEVAELLKKMSNISVRDKNSVSVIKDLVGIDPEYHVDPVFLCDYEGKIPSSVPMKDYFIVYGYKDRITEEEAEEINAFARKKGKKIITIGQKQRLEWEHIQPSPFEVLAYFQHADYILTDTFHGSVFSIKYGKKFATIIRDANSQKLSDLLKRFGLEDRILGSIQDMEQIITTDFDYDRVKQQIEEERKRSEEYLKNSIG